RVAEWDVLNEPLDDDTNQLRDTIWKHALGASYVATIFQWAHEADPEARLYVNEYGIEETGAKANALFTLVANARAAGVPIDGVVGLAAQLLGERPPLAHAAAALALGVTRAKIVERGERMAAAGEGELDRRAQRRALQLGVVPEQVQVVEILGAPAAGAVLAE